MIIKYKHNDFYKTIESPTSSPCCLSAMLNDKQASKKNDSCQLIVVLWSTGFHLISLHEKGFWSFAGLGRNREKQGR